MQEQKINRREILKTLVMLSIPTILEEILSTLLQYVDTAMVGHLGEKATASVSVTTTVTWLVNSIPAALGVAVLSMTAKALGSGDREYLQKIAKQILILVFACGLFAGGISVILSPYIPILMGAEPSIWQDASDYFLIVSLPMIFRSATMIMGAAIRGTKDTKTPMLINLGANGTNILLNIVFIYGMGLGVRGAAIASAISYTAAGLLMFAAYRRNEYLHWKWEHFAVDGKVMKECMRIGLPVLFSSIASCFGYVVFAGLVSGMGTTIFAAHSIAVTAETIFYISGYGLRTATSTLIGISLGEEDEKQMEAVASVSVKLTMILMCVSGVILFFVARPLMGLLTESSRVVEIGAGMLRIVAFSEPFYGLMIVTEGIFYGLGKTKYAFYVETFCMWGIRILFTFFCVKIWHFGLETVWYCMIADNVCKAVLFSVPLVVKRKRSCLTKLG